MSSTPDGQVRIAVTLPGGFQRVDLAPPDLTQSPQLAVEQWEGTRDASGHLLAWGCVAGNTSAWNADATEIAQDKLAELASKTVTAPMHVVRTAQNGHERALSADDGNATARTLLAFTPDHAHGCFVACESAACREAVDDAKLAGELAPPPAPGVALDALSWAVHHPHEALAAFGAVLALAAGLAIATRPGKRKKTKRSHS